PPARHCRNSGRSPIFRSTSFGGSSRKPAAERARGSSSAKARWSSGGAVWPVVSGAMAVAGSRAPAAAAVQKSSRATTTRSVTRASSGGRRRVSMRVLADELAERGALFAHVLVCGAGAGVDAGVERAQGGAAIARRQGRLHRQELVLQLFG